MESIQKSVKGEVKAINKSKYTADMKMSDETKDRDGEIIMLDSWAKHLPTFMKHPVLLDSHRMGNNEDILGKYSNVEIVAGEGLFAKAEYFVEQEKKNTPNKEKVRWAWVLVMNDLAAFSVRFIPYKAISLAELETLPEGIMPPHVLEQSPYRIYTEVELVECSQVTVPSNPNALLRSIDEFESKGSLVELSVAKGVFDKGLLSLPRKTFIIGSRIVENMPSKDSLLIRCTVDADKLSKLVDDAKSSQESRLDEIAVANCLEFEHIETLDDAESETIVELKGDPQISSTPLETSESEDILDDIDGFSLTEGDLKGLSDLISVEKASTSDVEGITENDLKRLSKALALNSKDSEHVDYRSEVELDDDEAAIFKRCLEVFGNPTGVALSRIENKS